MQSEWIQRVGSSVPRGFSRHFILETLKKKPHTGKELIDFATTVSFLIAPIIAIFNFKLVSGKYLAKDLQPPLWLKILSYIGIIFLMGFAIFFIITRFTLVEHSAK